MIVLRVIGFVLVSALVALRFRAVRQLLFRTLPKSQGFLDRYYPLDLKVMKRLKAMERHAYGEA